MACVLRTKRKSHVNERGLIFVEHQSDEYEIKYQRVLMLVSTPKQQKLNQEMRRSESIQEVVLAVKLVMLSSVDNMCISIR